MKNGRIKTAGLRISFVEWIRGQVSPSAYPCSLIRAKEKKKKHLGASQTRSSQSAAALPFGFDGVSFFIPRARIQHSQREDVSFHARQMHRCKIKLGGTDWRWSEVVAFHG